MDSISVPRLFQEAMLLIFQMFSNGNNCIGANHCKLHKGEKTTKNHLGTVEFHKGKIAIVVNIIVLKNSDAN